VVVADVDRIGGESVVGEIVAGGGTACFQATDVTSRADVQAMVRTAVEAYGGIDALAHVAAIAVHEPFLSITDELWRRTLDVCLTGCFLVNQEVARVMVPQGRGRIVNFASTVAATGGGTLAAYSAAKAGVVALSKTVQQELAGSGIVVAVVAPGATDTPLYRRGRSDEDLATRARRLPFGRAAAAEEVAEVVAFLADDATAHLLAGQTVHTNGGIYLA
jgi:NAD(P)-dependent dehydrogenase (short-subunit alcohol dehydrogenase family)